MNPLYRMGLFVLVACGGKTPGADPSAHSDSGPSTTEGPETGDDTAEDTSHLAPEPGVQIAFVEAADWGVVDECETTCISAVVTQDGEPVLGVLVDVGVENKSVGVSLPTNQLGIAEACTPSLPVGEWTAVAVATVEGHTVQVEAPIDVRGFGHIDGCMREFIVIRISDDRGKTRNPLKLAVDGQRVVRKIAVSKELPAIAVLTSIPKVTTKRLDLVIAFRTQVHRPAKPIGVNNERADIYVCMMKAGVSAFDS